MFALEIAPVGFKRGVDRVMEEAQSGLDGSGSID